jgi:hypothetical protein
LVSLSNVAAVVPLAEACSVLRRDILLALFFSELTTSTF